MDCVRLFVHLTPKAAGDRVGEIMQMNTGAVLKVRVRALPDKNAANQALIKLLAKWLGVPKSSLELASGSCSRYKTIKIFGKTSEIVRMLETCTK